jgi:hypothetical protein
MTHLLCFYRYWLIRNVNYDCDKPFSQVDTVTSLGRQSSVASIGSMVKLRVPAAKESTRYISTTEVSPERDFEVKESKFRSRVSKNESQRKTVKENDFYDFDKPLVYWRHLNQNSVNRNPIFSKDKGMMNARPMEMRSQAVEKYVQNVL